jgi:hypothetical protein
MADRCMLLPSFFPFFFFFFPHIRLMMLPLLLTKCVRLNNARLLLSLYPIVTSPKFPWLLPLWKRTVSILTRFILFLHAKWMVDSRWLERLWAFPG